MPQCHLYLLPSRTKHHLYCRPSRSSASYTKFKKYLTSAKDGPGINCNRSNQEIFNPREEISRHCRLSSKTQEIFNSCHYRSGSWSSQSPSLPRCVTYKLWSPTVSHSSRGPPLCHIQVGCLGPPVSTASPVPRLDDFLVVECFPQCMGKRRDPTAGPSPQMSQVRWPRSSKCHKLWSPYRHTSDVVVPHCVTFKSSVPHCVTHKSDVSVPRLS